MRSIVGRKNIFSAWYWMALPLFMAGCANTGGPGQQANMGQELLKEAQQAVASGARTRAQNLLEEATRSNPTDKQPWIKLAQLHFEQNQYAQAITAGQEVLSRDSSNLDARSIVLVSSLRIAAKSLEELSISNQLAGDTKTEARKVTHMLRETLGETVLVPANRTTGSADGKQVDGAESAKKVSQERAPARRPVKTIRAKPETSRPAATGGSSDSDPFHSLR